MACKILICTLCVDPTDAQDKNKHSVGPVTGLPSFLNGNRLHAVVVVVIHHMPVLIVVVVDLGKFEGMYLLIFVSIREDKFFQFTFLIHCSIG
jgi:hypothetical protein